MSEFKIKATDRWNNRYSYAYKKEIIEQVENGHLSQNQAAKKYGVSRTAIASWIKKYGNLDRKLREMGGKSPKEEIVELRAKLRAMEAENIACKFVIDVMKEEYGDDVVKKYLPGHLWEQFNKSKVKKSK